jgi:4-amino-4-deoxy-L-arabinose transferase-like glycosyltransferase
MTKLFRRSSDWLSRHPRQALLAAAALILLVHLATVLVLPEGDLAPDEQRYIRIAENLLSTGTFGVEPDQPFALNAPLYPYLVATIFAASGYSLLAVRLVQIAVGTINSLVTFKLARTLFPRRPAAAWLSMLCVGFYPVFILWEGMILTETVYILTVQLCCWWWVRAICSPTWQNALLSGAGFGLTMVTRETLVLFIPVALVTAILIADQHRVRYAVLAAIACLLVMTPWIVRNYLTFGLPFFTERTAYMVYKVTGYGYVSPFWQDWDARDTEEGTSSEVLDQDDLAYAPMRYMWNLSFARRDPILYARILVARLFELWLHPNGLDRLPGPLKLPYQVGHGLILLLAGCGLWIAARERHWPLLAWSLILPYVTVFSIYFKPNPRYTLPFLPLVFTLAALGIYWIWQFLRRKVTMWTGSEVDGKTA